MHRLLILVASLSPAALAADPPAPPGGFATQRQTDILLAYTDGYKTYMNAVWPKHVPPKTGWPCILLMHGGGGSRNHPILTDMQDYLAKFGYLAVAYDARGSDDTRKLNPNKQHGPAVQRMIDIAEFYRLAEKHFGNAMDFDRLAITGKSAGGGHSLWAAAYSERKLPQSSLTMPKILASMPDMKVIDEVEDNAPGGGTMVQSKLVVDAFKKGGANNAIVKAIRAGNYARLLQKLRSEPTKNYYSLLQTSDVPIMIQYGWDDRNHWINILGDRLPGLKAGVPHRVLISANGHRTPLNDIEFAIEFDLKRRWCDRFLKGIANNIDKEPLAELGVMPNDTARYQNRSSAWKHRHVPSWPPAYAKTRKYLRSGGVLSAQPPSGTETGPTIKHRIATGYDLIGYLTDAGKPAKVTRSIPLDAATFDTLGNSEQIELLGRAIAEFDVQTTAGTFQVQAALLDVPPNGSPRFITSGVTARRNGQPGRHRVMIELGDIAYVLPKGHKLQLSIENMNVRRWPSFPHFFVLPEFTDVDITVHIDTNFPPRIDLPILTAGSSLSPRIATVSASKGIDHTLTLEGEALRAGHTYQIFISASGSWPGTKLPSAWVPLNVDAWTHLGVGAVNTRYFSAFAGKLDAHGVATARFMLPANLAKQVAGAQLSLVGVGISGKQLWSSNAVALHIDP